MTKSVTWRSCQRLSCAGQTTPDVVLCLSDSSLVAPKACPAISADTIFDYSTIDAVLTSNWKDVNVSCSSSNYTYLFAYDENQLADPTTPLTQSQIVGVFCKGCLTTWIEELVGNETYLKTNDDSTVSLISPHGCEYQFTNSATVEEVALLLCNTNSPRTESELITDLGNNQNICICSNITLTANLTIPSTRQISFNPE